MEIPKGLSDAWNHLEKDLLGGPWTVAPGPVALASLVASGKAPGRENIIGLGLGRKYTAGVATGELCVRVYMVQKFPSAVVDQKYLVRPQIEGFKTDVMELGTVVAYQLIRKFRPAPAGVSIGHPKVTAGTLGALLRCDGEVFILSNNHVLANSNLGSAGDAILQPAFHDGGVQGRDDLGTVHDFVPIDFAQSGRNYADAALATPKGNWYEQVVPFVLRLGEVRGVREPLVDLEVQKMGRTTRHTRGRVEDVSVTVMVGYAAGQVATFYDQISIRSVDAGVTFSLGGDSGSLIVDENGLACALLFAGSADGRTTFATPINVVLNELRNLPSLAKTDIWTFPW